MRALVALLALLIATQAPAYEIRRKGHIVKIDRVAHIYGNINFASEFVFDSEIMSVITLDGPQVILINSEGGDLNAGQHILDQIYALKAEGHTIICIVEGMAASMAFNILTQCDERYATRDSIFLFHPIAGYTEDHGRMTPKNLRRMAAELEEDERPFKAANSQALHMDSATYDYYANKDRQWTAQQMKARHYLKGIVRTGHGETNQSSGTPAPQGG